jgi:hypothetical protein
MRKPVRFLLKNHRGCAHCSDAEMVIDDKGPLVGYAFYELLEAENTRLKAEVERLKEENEVLQNRCDFLEGRNKK